MQLLGETITNLFYVDTSFVVLGTAEGPLIIKKEQGAPDLKVVKEILRRTGMKLNGSVVKRPDGLWCHQLEEM